MAITKQNLLQAEAIGARYAANWSARHTTPAVAHVNGGAGGGLGGRGGEGGKGSANSLLAGTKFDPFAGGGGQVGGRAPDRSPPLVHACGPAHARAAASPERATRRPRLPLWPSTTTTTLTRVQEALDSPLEELGQTFELKFYAPLSAGACAMCKLRVVRHSQPDLAFLGPLPHLPRFHQQRVCPPTRPPARRQVRPAAAVHARLLGGLRQGGAHQAQGGRAAGAGWPGPGRGWRGWQWVRWG